MLPLDDAQSTDELLALIEMDEDSRGESRKPWARPLSTSSGDIF